MAGRKKLPSTEKKKRVTVFVKAKNAAKAKTKLLEVAKKFN